jgi:hypothetical protein
MTDPFDKLAKLLGEPQAVPAISEPGELEEILERARQLANNLRRGAADMENLFGRAGMPGGYPANEIVERLRVLAMALERWSESDGDDDFPP